MSMNTYPIREQAVLLITGELARAVTRAALGADCESEDMSEAKDALESLGVEACYCSEFEGTATPFDTDNSQEDINFDDDYIVYIPCAKEATLFTAAYGSVDELLNEFRQHFKGVNIDLAGIRLLAYVYSLEGTYVC